MAQSILTLIPNYVQVVADDSAGTVTVQVWNSSTLAWDAVNTLTTSSEEFSIAKLMTVNGGLTVNSGNTQLGSTSGNMVKSYNNTLDDGSGNVTVAGAINVDKAINQASSPASFAGTTAGTVYWNMPFQGAGYKKVVVYLSGYENDTTTAQTITFPTAFTDTPYIAANTASVPGVTVSTTALSINPDSTSTYSGWLVIEGF